MHTYICPVQIDQQMLGNSYALESSLLVQVVGLYLVALVTVFAAYLAYYIIQTLLNEINFTHDLHYAGILLQILTFLLCCANNSSMLK